jgi:hypothetical protein
MNKFIKDKEELKKFFDVVMPPLSNEEVYFCSMSARNKLLNEEEKTNFSLGRTEMLFRQIIREKNWMKFLRTIHKYETDENAITGRNGIPLPMKCLIIYFNINPCNMVKAYRLFQTEMNMNVCNLLEGTGSSPDFFKRMDRLLMNAIQKSSGTKHYIDIDIDATEEYRNSFKFYEFVGNFGKALKKEGVQYFVVFTRGGAHILLKKNTIHFNYNKVIFDFQMKGTEDNMIKEMGYNSNGMIPLPGTLQGNFLVTVDYTISNWENKNTLTT